MKLLIDDIRDLPADVIARNFDSAERMLRNHNWDEITFDNDLGDPDTIRDGYKLMEICMGECYLGQRKFPKTIAIVTANPVALKRMQYLLEFYGYAPNPSKLIWTASENTLTEAEENAMRPTPMPTFVIRSRP